MPSNFTTPVGRLLQGSLYKPSTTDTTGRPLTVKNGPNAGQPKVEYFFSVGILKGQEQHWSQTPWGALIWAEGHKAFPQHAQSNKFAWKVIDGDSQEFNEANPPKRICDLTGHKGHWVLKFKSGFAPKIYNKDGSQQLLEPEAVKCGYYIQVNATVDGNGSQQRPGVYLNHGMVAMSAYGEEIFQGPDVAAAGFGNAPLPAGAMAAPVASGAFNPAPPVAGPAVPHAYMHPANAPTSAPAPYTPVPAAVRSPEFLMPPGVAAVPPLPPAPPAPLVAAGPVMTPAAGGATYQQMKDLGWTDDLLRKHGYML